MCSKIYDKKQYKGMGGWKWKYTVVKIPDHTWGDIMLFKGRPW